MCGFGGLGTSCLRLKKKTLAGFQKPENRCVITLENIQADTPELVDVWVVDLGQEADLGWCHGVIVWKEELELEDSTCIVLSEVCKPGCVATEWRGLTFVWRLAWAVYRDIEVSQVVLMRNSADTGNTRY